jgi:Tfp pilus assembly protein PilO
MSNLTSIILIVASLGLFFGYIDPTYSDIKRDVSSTKGEFEQALENSKNVQEERNKLMGKYTTIREENISKLAKMLPDNIDNVRLLIELERLANAHSMRIRDFRADTGEKSETIGQGVASYGTLTLSFSTTATYNTFLAFLRDLERNRRILDITTISFASSDTNDVYDYSLTLKTYWLK